MHDYYEDYAFGALIIGLVVFIVVVPVWALTEPNPQHQMQPKEQVIETRGPTLYDT